MRWKGILHATVAITALSSGLAGCAALPLAVVAGSLMDAGGGVLVKTGTEYTASGTVRRTFNLSADQVHAAVLESFARAQIAVTHDQPSAKRDLIVATTQHRKVRVQITPLTPALTALELDVKRNFFASDKATASEILAETEQVVAERTVVAAADEPAIGTAVSAARPTRPEAASAQRRRGR